jgi:hypothetical protein
VGRSYLAVTERITGIASRFFYDREDPTRLHIERRWGVSPEQALRAFFDTTAEVTWIPEKRCYETRTADHVLVWLWQDEQAQSEVVVITCVPVEGTQGI